MYNDAKNSAGEKAVSTKATGKLGQSQYFDDFVSVFYAKWPSVLGHHGIDTPDLEQLRKDVLHQYPSDSAHNYVDLFTFFQLEENLSECREILNQAHKKESESGVVRQKAHRTVFGDIQTVLNSLDDVVFGHRYTFMLEGAAMYPDKHEQMVFLDRTSEAMTHIKRTDEADELYGGVGEAQFDEISQIREERGLPASTGSSISRTEEGEGGPVTGVENR